MIPIKLTNLLGSITGKSEYLFNSDKKSIDTPLNKEIFYSYEAQLAQCAYLSRLVYTPSEVFLHGVQFLDQAPDVMNAIITQLEHSFYSRMNFQDLFISHNIPNDALEVHGAFFPKTGCAIFQHHNPSSRINTKKTLYVVFKGSSSMRDFMSDLNIIKTPFAEIPQLADLPGTTHGGFWKHMRAEVDQIMGAVVKFSQSMERIVVTGHSLGGAMATLFSLMVANQIRKGVLQKLPLHCVSFGAPNLLSDDARQSYNSFLLDGTLTLDRVTGESKGLSGALVKTFAGPAAIDVIIMIPGAFFSHPGFNILKTELYATSRTGRAKDIDDVRSVFLGKENAMRRPGAGPNELPADPVFWNLFDTLPTTNPSEPTLDTRLANYGTLKWYKDPTFVKFVLRGIPLTSIDQQPDVTPTEEGMIDNAEDAAMKADTQSITAVATSQSGGGIEPYKQATLKQFPNRVNYQCYKRLSAGFCHAAYMGIGFLSAIRLPVLYYRDETGKLRSKLVRKLEPVYITEFVGNGLNPASLYYARQIMPQTAGQRSQGATRRKRRTISRKYRRTIHRKHYR